MYCEYITDATIRGTYDEDYGTEYWCNFTGQQDSQCGGSITRPCHAGYDCADGRCRRACQADNDCPCDAENNQDFSCWDNRCSHCVYDIGDECGSNTAYGDVCCKDELTCGSVGTCCTEQGESCGTDDECCVFDQESCIDGTCEPCNDFQGACDSDQDCCKGKCSGGECVSTCQADKPCNSGQP
jgi:hypothetical protein